MKREVLKELPLSAAALTGGMLQEYQQLLVEEMLPYQIEILEQGGALDMIRRAAGYRVPERTEPGRPTDVGKLLEATAYALLLREDPALKRKLEELIGLLEQAQYADGYLHPIMQASRPSDRFLSLLMSHEMYTLSHYMEGLLACYEALGNEQALRCARGIGDCLCQWFGTEPGKIRGYDGHPEVELALYRLYGCTGEKKYLECLRFFVEERGRSGPEHPHYFDWEQQRNREKFGKPVLGELSRWADRHRPYWGNYEYFQAHLPARQLRKPTGHAVRATYFYCGMADLAMETGDEELMEACRSLWQGFEQGNVALNGSIGQDGFWEGIGRAYDLPPDYSYNETCAAIGLFLFGHRMMRLEPDGAYGDQMELSLYNTVLAGTSLDGRHYFYCNPLEVWPHSLYRYDKIHIQARRYEWDDCPCCPPNVARLLGELGRFAVLSGRQEAWVNLYTGLRCTLPLDSGPVRMEMVTEYPREGRIRITVLDSARFTLRLRIPAWCREWRLLLNGERTPAAAEKGFAALERSWQPGDCAVLELEMPCHRVYADPRAYHLAHQTAVMRGPLLYCAEQADNGELLSRILLPDSSVLEEHWEEDLLGGVYTVTAEARRAMLQEGPLYRAGPPAWEKMQLKLVPYYTWANREEGEMRVFFPEIRTGL